MNIWEAYEKLKEGKIIRAETARGVIYIERTNSIIFGGIKKSEYSYICRHVAVDKAIIHKIDCSIENITFFRNSNYEIELNDFEGTFSVINIEEIIQEINEEYRKSLKSDKNE